MNVGTGVRVTVMVLVGMSVAVGVKVIVIDAVNDGMTKEVKVGMGVEEGLNVACCEPCVSSGNWVQVGGRDRGDGVEVGMMIKTVGRAVGGGNGLIVLFSSRIIYPKSPHKQRVDRIIKTDRISQMVSFTAFNPFWRFVQEWVSGAATPVSIYYF